MTTTNTYQNMKISKMTPESAYMYAKDIIKGRWVEAESIIKQEPEYAFFYALDVIKGRWVEAESIIKQNPRYAYDYARDVLKCSWEELEKHDENNTIALIKDIVLELNQLSTKLKLLIDNVNLI